MFDHFSFLLENSNILLSRPSLRGSTPLDVAYSSLMENTELALALRYLLKIKVVTNTNTNHSNNIPFFLKLHAYIEIITYLYLN